MIAFTILMAAGCVDIDAMIHNPVHCSTIGPATCEQKGEWDAICLPCDQPLPWDRDYPWMDGTLGAGDAVRPIDPAEVVDAGFTTADGAADLDAWYIPAHGDDPEAAALTLVYNHGNYAGIEHYLPRVRMLHELGYGIFVWDYRGYGKSEPMGTPTPQQFLDDAALAYERAGDFAEGARVPYAYSLGAIPGVEMAIVHQPCALLMEAPFTSMTALVEGSTTLGVPGSFVSDGRFENIEKIAGYEGPVLAMIGTVDPLFPVDDVAQMLDNAPGATALWVLPGVSHGISGGGVPEAGLGQYGDRLRTFLDQNAADCSP
ncbi:MAG: alpha/beta hydrolase [Alphaproteobacteria bacterium]|nr:alpha/beta hydrolase [Alphaproteobacteria bacterium]